MKKNTNPPMVFAEALIKMVEGKKVTRVDWPEGEYGFIDTEGFLKIKRINGLFQWMLHKLDITATDWLIVVEVN
jgi:hypothetical protein